MLLERMMNELYRYYLSIHKRMRERYAGTSFARSQLARVIAVETLRAMRRAFISHCENMLLKEEEEEAQRVRSAKETKAKRAQAAKRKLISDAGADGGAPSRSPRPACPVACSSVETVETHAPRRGLEGFLR